MTTVSFYSFKGGVGRTFVAAECAAQLARRGLRVCYWDLDLEAPALHRHHQLDPRHPFPLGTLDLIERADESGTVPLELIESALVRVAIDDGDGPSIHVLFAAGSDAFSDGPAGTEGSGSFADRYWAIDWNAEYASNRAINVFLSIADRLSERFDVVIVDSRTGLTDVGYLATRILADAVVVVFGLSDQNLEGLRRAYDAIVRPQGSQPPPPVRLVANLVPDDISRASNPRLGAAYDAQRRRLHDLALAPDHELPLVPARLVDDLVPSLRGGARDEAEPFLTLVDWVDDQVPRPEAPDTPTSMAKARTFEADVAGLLRYSGWQVDHIGTSDIDADLVARRHDALSPIPLLVRCFSGATAGREHVDRVAAALARFESTEGRLSTAALVTAHPPSAATAAAATSRGVALLTIDDLVEQVLPAEPLLSHIGDQLRSSRPARNLMPRAGMVRNAGTTVPMADVVLDWLRLDEGPSTLLVIGEAGTGKSTELKRIVELLAELRSGLKEPTGSPLPLWIDVRSVDAGDDLTMVLARTMWAIWRSTDVDALSYLWASGRIVIVIDGLDEGPHDTDRRWLRQLTEAPGKVLLASRPDPRLDTLPDECVRVVELAPVDGEIIRHYLSSHLGPTLSMGLLHRIRDARAESMPLTPLMLELLVAAASRIGTDKKRLRGPGLVTVIEMALAAWAVDVGNVPDDLPSRVLVALALERWRAVDPSSPDVLTRAVHPFVAEGHDVGPLLARCPLLVDDDGRYRFLHDVVEHYFLAQAVRTAAVDRRWGTFDEARLPQGIRLALAPWAAEDPDTARVALKRAVAELGSGNQLISRRLATNLVIFVHAADPTLPMRRAALANVDLSGLELHGIQLPWADLGWADLTGTLLRGADLGGADLTGADLTGADLRGADLSAAKLTGAILVRVDLRGTQRRATDLTGAQTEGAIFD